MRLFGTMCNQPQRLSEALAPARAALVAAPPIARWGLGYVQSGEVLLARTPRPSASAIDLYAALEGVKSDCVLGHAVPGRGAPPASRGSRADGGTEETPPFRYRRWMWVQDAPSLGAGGAGPGAEAEAPEAGDGGPQDLLFAALAGEIPDHLRRNLKGRGTAELGFHVLLAMLHDLGGIDDPNLAMPVMRRALADALARVGAELARHGVGDGLGCVAMSNGRSMLLARPAGAPGLWLRRLHVHGERGRDESFRGVLFVAACVGDTDAELELPAAAGDGFEEIPAGSVVGVSRDLRVDVSPLAA